MKYKNYLVDVIMGCLLVFSLLFVIDGVESVRNHKVNDSKISK